MQAFFPPISFVSGSIFYRLPVRCGQSCAAGALHRRNVHQDVRAGPQSLLHVLVQPLRLLRGAVWNPGDDHVLGWSRDSAGVLCA